MNSMSYFLSSFFKNVKKQRYHLTAREYKWIGIRVWGMAGWEKNMNLELGQTHFHIYKKCLASLGPLCSNEKHTQLKKMRKKKSKQNRSNIMISFTLTISWCITKQSWKLILQQNLRKRNEWQRKNKNKNNNKQNENYTEHQLKELDERSHTEQNHFMHIALVSHFFQHRIRNRRRLSTLRLTKQISLLLGALTIWCIDCYRISEMFIQNCKFN